jgi:hypothetical protein
LGCLSCSNSTTSEFLWNVLLCVIIEVAGEWRKLHIEELRDLYSSPSIIRIMKSRRIRWAGHLARMGAKGNAYKLLAGKPGGRRPLGRPRRRWVDNNRMDVSAETCSVNSDN